MFKKNALMGVAALAVSTLLLLPFRPGYARADEIKVAVAANFTAAAKEIAAAFEAETGNKVLLSFGSTGKLYAQIENGAPFEAFLAADQKRPEKAEKAGLAVDGSRFTYATGKLVLFSADPALVDGEGKGLSEGKFAKLAIANPKTAPYGAAAMEVMANMGLADKLADRIVQGDSISQTLQFVTTGNAPLGFVALSQTAGGLKGSSWVVPGDLYKPIRQDVVLLKTGADSATAKAFVDYLRGDKAKAVIEKFGYGIE